MLSASGHKLYFYYNASRDDASSRMEIDFLISKSNSRVTFLRVYYFPCPSKLRETISIHSFSHFSLFYQHLIYFFHIIFRCRRNHGIIHLLQFFRRCLQCICDLVQVLALFYLLYQQNDLALLRPSCRPSSRPSSLASLRSSSRCFFASNSVKNTRLTSFLFFIRNSLRISC